MAEEELIPVRSYEVFGSSETPIYGQSPGDPTTRHADLIGTAAATSTDDGQSLTYEYPVYTAFGELAGGNPGDGRYGYAGEWGYETGLLVLAGASGTAPITLQHLGARWYDPGLGRFIQRDPIGIQGGLNVFLYCGAEPSAVIDPTGSIPEVIKDIIWPGGPWWKFWPSFRDGGLRYGPVLDKASGQTVTRAAAFGTRGGWPLKAIHVTGRAAAIGTVGALCVVAAGVGYGVGWGFNEYTRAKYGISFSEALGNFLYPPITYIPPGDNLPDYIPVW